MFDLMPEMIIFSQSPNTEPVACRWGLNGDNTNISSSYTCSTNNASMGAFVPSSLFTLGVGVLLHNNC